MDISERKIDDIIIVAISGRIDISSSKELDEYLDKVVDSKSKVILDLSDTEYISSSGLRVILVALKKSKKNKGSFNLASPQLMVRNVLEISGLSNVFSIYRDLDEAINGLKADTKLLGNAND
jgi:anti-sigma B factor antagonist